MLRARITGTGSSVPEKVMSNSDLEKCVDTNDEWITTRTGIKERRIASKGEYTSTFATIAARRALEMSGISAEELDIIILATVTGDFPFPATACIIQNELGAKKSLAFDISAACSGFIYGLNMAEAYIKSGMARKILVMGAEVLTSIVDFSDRNTCILFGDGAGAAVVEATEADNGILSTHVYTNGAHWGLLYQPAVGSRHRFTDPETTDEKLYFLRMEGNEVFKHAVRAMGDAASEALNRNGFTAADLALLIPHQANRRIIEATGKRIGIPEDKIFVNLHKYGNTSAASIPIALDEANRTGRIKPDDLVLLAAFGGGFTYGSALLKW